MECLTEFTCSVFVDGELPEQELREVEQHLEACRHCREMAAEFREESRLLVHYIQEIDLMEPVPATSAPARVPATQRPARPADVAKFGGLLVGVSALIKLVTSSPENFVLPSIPVNLDWLDPSNLSGSLNWLIGTIAFVAEEGVSGMASLVSSMSVVAMYILILAGVVTLVRRSIGKGAMAALVGALGAILLVVMSSSSSYAMDVRKSAGNQWVTISAGQVVDDSLFATGETVVIDGTVNGDLIAFARHVIVNGTVKGSILTGAQTIDISGVVEGGIVMFGQTIQIGGKVARNVAGFSQSVTMGKEASIGGDLTAFAGETHVNGAVGRSVYANGFVDIAGSVGRNVTFHGGIISIFPTARIGGDLMSYVRKAEEVHVDPGATIGGKQTMEFPKPEPNRYATFKFYFSELLHVAAAFVAGMILLLLFPTLRGVGFPEVTTALKSAGIGFLIIVATPLAALILAITLIGLPIALVGMVTWLLGIYLAKIIVATFVGRTLLSSPTNRMSSMALGLLVGLVLVFVVINLPFVGGLMHSLLVLTGLGALAMSVFNSYQASRDFGK